MMNFGSNSIPTDAKNSTANASRSGSASAAAWLETTDRPTTMPARKAPRAIDKPNSVPDATAIPEPAHALPRPVDNHLSYALTWFGLAATLLVIFILYARKVLRP